MSIAVKQWNEPKGNFKKHFNMSAHFEDFPGAWLTSKELRAEYRRLRPSKKPPRNVIPWPDDYVIYCDRSMIDYYKSMGFTDEKVPQPSNSKLAVLHMSYDKFRRLRLNHFVFRSSIKRFAGKVLTDESGALSPFKLERDIYSNADIRESYSEEIPVGCSATLDVPQYNLP